MDIGRIIPGKILKLYPDHTPMYRFRGPAWGGLPKNYGIPRGINHFIEVYTITNGSHLGPGQGAIRADVPYLLPLMGGSRGYKLSTVQGPVFITPSGPCRILLSKK
jgi:hypothetical protein